jgi:hypothetical protein
MPGELELAEFIAKILFKLVGMKKGRTKEQKKAVAKYLSGIADTLSQFRPAFEQKDLAKMNTLACQTSELAKRFEEVAKGALSAEDVKIFIRRLTVAANDKALLSEVSEDERQGTGKVNIRLTEIAQIEGIFRGLSMTLEAMAIR